MILSNPFFITRLGVNSSIKLLQRHTKGLITVATIDVVIHFITTVVTVLPIKTLCIVLYKYTIEVPLPK